MNFQNFRLEYVEAETDWKVFGDMTDDQNNILGTFGPDGTLVSPWWYRQDDGFQYGLASQFAIGIARIKVSEGSINLQQFRIDKVNNDWLIFGNIEDDAGNILDTFGESGTSITQFWLSQPQEWQIGYVQRFAIAMAQEILAGTAE
jgi:hypothetical protein